MLFVFGMLRDTRTLNLLSRQYRWKENYKFQLPRIGDTPFPLLCMENTPFLTNLLYIKILERSLSFGRILSHCSSLYFSQCSLEQEKYTWFSPPSAFIFSLG